MVPMLAEACPSRSQIWRVKAATEVLPLVPVTAAIVASMKRAPSVLWPASAKNRSPGFTTRLSTASPLTSTAAARGAIVASSLKRSRSFMISLVRQAPESTRPYSLHGLLGCLRCRKNKAVGRRQIEARLDAQKRRDAGDHIAAGRHRVPARGDETVGFLQRLRLVQHDQKLVAGIVGRQDRGKGGQHALLDVA